MNKIHLISKEWPKDPQKSYLNNTIDNFCSQTRIALNAQKVFVLPEKELLQTVVDFLESQQSENDLEEIVSCMEFFENNKIPNFECNTHINLKTKKGKIYKKILCAPILLQNGERYGGICALDPQSENAELTLRKHCAIITFIFESYFNTLSEKLLFEKQKQFYAYISHEVRNSLNGVKGLSELLQRTSLNKEQAELANTIKSSTDATISIVNDVLDFSKMSSGKMNLHIKEFDLEKWLKEATSATHLEAEKRGIQFVVDNQNIKGLSVSSDPNRLLQVISNLLTNSLKFTKSGRIEIKMHVAQDKSEDHIFASIIDTGIGMPDSFKTKIFTPYEQTHNDELQHLGTGLGLSIVKNILNLMGGDISVQSIEGVGSRFDVKVPCKVKGKQNNKAIARTTHITTLSKKPSQVPEKNLLIAEDNKINQKVICGLLKDFMPNLNIVVVENGKEALQKLDERSFDLILMDCQMPEMDGFEATYKIRQLSSSHPNWGIPIIAVTANAMVGDRQKCIEAGMSSYLTKPIVDSELRSAVSSWLGLKTNTPEILATQKEAVVDGERISGLKSKFGPNADEVMNDVLELYIAEVPAKLEELWAHVEAKDFKRVSELTHYLKGASLNVGAQRLSSILKKFELDAKESKDTDFLPLFAAICSEVPMVIEELNKFIVSTQKQPHERRSA